MNDSQSKLDQKKSWSSPRIVDIGSVDELTTAGKGNLGDQATGADKYKPFTSDIAKDAVAILPEGE